MIRRELGASPNHFWRRNFIVTLGGWGRVKNTRWRDDPDASGTLASFSVEGARKQGASAK